MAKRPEVRCSLEGGGPAAPSKFVLISAVAGGGTIPLLNGVNIIEVDSSVEVVGVGLNPSEEDVKPQGGAYEKHVSLQTTAKGAEGIVLLEASRAVRIRGRQSISSPSPRRANPTPARSAQAPPGKGARASPSKRPQWTGGGTTLVNPGAPTEGLLVGDTLDLGTGGAGNFQRRFSFTLHLASSVAAAEAAGGGGSSSGAGAGAGGTKRRLEGSFADKGGDEPIEIEDSSDDDVPKRPRRDRGESNEGKAPCDPIGMVDLCGPIGLPPINLPGDAGKSKALPLDLCDSDDSDDDGDAGGPAAAASAARAAPTPSSDSGGGGSSSGGGASSSSASPKRGVEPKRRVPPPTRIDGDVPEPGVCRQEPRAEPAAVDADVSMVEAAPPTTIENDQPEAPPPSPPSSPFRPLSLKPSSPLRAPSPSVEEEEKPVQRSPTTACHAPGGGGGGGAAGPMVKSSAPPIQARPRMHDDLRNSLKIALKNNHEQTIPVVDEFLARGMAPHSTLCKVLMAELLESRCSRRNECLRRQLRAMLDVDPDCWEPPDLDAPAWLQAVMRGMTTGMTPKYPEIGPRGVVVEAHAVVLEAVVDYLAAGRRKRGTPLQTPPQAGPPTTAAMSASATVLQFFPEEEEKKTRKKGGGAQPRKKSPKKPTQAQKNAELARRAVDMSAAWAASVWGLTVGPGGEAKAGAGAGAETGAGAGAPPRRRQRRRRPRQEEDSPALARARVVATRFLAEVVESCGLPVSDACGAIRDQMNLFAAAPGVAGAAKGGAGYRGTAAADAAGGAAAPGATDEGCRGLGAAARGGLVRALIGRPFCPQLAEVLLEDLGGAGDRSPRSSVGTVGRLRGLLSRVVRRRKVEGDSDPDLLLSVGS